MSSPARAGRRSAAAQHSPRGGGSSLATRGARARTDAGEARHARRVRLVGRVQEAPAGHAVRVRPGETLRQRRGRRRRSAASTTSKRRRVQARICDSYSRCRGRKQHSKHRNSGSRGHASGRRHTAPAASSPHALRGRCSAAQHRPARLRCCKGAACARLAAQHSRSRAINSGGASGASPAVTPRARQLSLPVVTWSQRPHVAASAAASPVSAACIAFWARAGVAWRRQRPCARPQGVQPQRIRARPPPAAAGARAGARRAHSCFPRPVLL